MESHGIPSKICENIALTCIDFTDLCRHFTNHDCTMRDGDMVQCSNGKYKYESFSPDSISIETFMEQGPFSHPSCSLTATHWLRKVAWEPDLRWKSVGMNWLRISKNHRTGCTEFLTGSSSMSTFRSSCRLGTSLDDCDTSRAASFCCISWEDSYVKMVGTCWNLGNNMK